MDRIKIELGEITEFEGDAIVNAANEQLIGGGGVDGAIHRAAGPQLLEECKKLGGCAVGQAKITGGYNLKAKHVIHTVGPIWEGGENDEEELLESCYTNSLWLAEEHQIRTMAFPAISTGAYGYPKDQAAQIAIVTAKRFLETNELPEQVTFICFDEDSLVLYEAINEDENEDTEDLEDPNIWNIRDEAFRLVTGKPMSIWAASYTGNIDRVKIHLDAGVNVNELADGQSPLHYAAEGGMSESVKLLIDKNADVNAKNKDGNTPLHLAALKGKKKIIKAGKQDLSKTIGLLTTEGADVNVKNNKGNTPLHLAAKIGDKEISQLLIAEGANVDTKNKHGKTPLDLADKEEVAALLIQHDHKKQEDSIISTLFYFLQIPDSSKAAPLTWARVIISAIWGIILLVTFRESLFGGNGLLTSIAIALSSLPWVVFYTKDANKEARKLKWWQIVITIITGAIMTTLFTVLFMIPIYLLKSLFTKYLI